MTVPCPVVGEGQGGEDQRHGTGHRPRQSAMETLITDLEGGNPMRHSISFALAFVMMTLLAPATRAAGNDGDKPLDEATKLAVKLTEEGAATFDTLNAKAMA